MPPAARLPENFANSARFTIRKRRYNRYEPFGARSDSVLTSVATTVASGQVRFVTENIVQHTGRESRMRLHGLGLLAWGLLAALGSAVSAQPADSLTFPDFRVARGSGSRSAPPMVVRPSAPASASASAPASQPPSEPPSEPVEGQIWQPLPVPGEVFGEEIILDESHPFGCECASCFPEPINGPWGMDPAEFGFGVDRVPYATFEITPARPQRMLQIEFESAWNQEFPDRTEYFWARNGGGGFGPPEFERSVDWWEMRFHIEQGGSQMALITEHVIRGLDPEVNGNTVGYGDMTIGPKVVVYEDVGLWISYLNLTHIPTGLPRRGLGTGHVSMEHALLMDWQLSCLTHVHGELDWWINLSGPAEFRGTFLKYGLGVSHLLYERPNHNFAIIPVFEAVGWSVVDGMQTGPDGTVFPVDPDTIVNLYGGSRVLLNEKCELGLNVGGTLTTNRWYESRVRIDFRILW